MSTVPSLQSKEYQEVAKWVHDNAEYWRNI